MSHQGYIGRAIRDFWLWVDTLMHPEILTIAYGIAGSQAAFEALDRADREVVLTAAVAIFEKQQTSEGRS